MAGYRRLASGKWQATVRTPMVLPSGERLRITETHKLKSIVKAWADKQETAIKSGTWTPYAGTSHGSREMTLGEYRAQWVKTRIADGATSDKNESQWRTHVEPVWAGYPLALITRHEIKAWVHRMHTEQCRGCKRYPGLTQQGVLRRHKRPTGTLCSQSGTEPGLGAWTVQGAAAHLSGLISAAVEDGLLDANPATKLRLPTAAPKPIFYWTREEAAALLLELGGTDALAVDLNMHIGLRPGELFGLRRQYVDTSAWLIHVHGVATRRGWRAYAKTAMSHRAVPIPRHLREQLLAHVLDLGPDDLVFPGPEGGLQNDRNYAQRVFEPALAKAKIRTGTPYDMRHTAASWLVQLGVDLLRVQELLGHEKYSTTLRYSHLRPGQFGEVIDAWGSAPLDLRDDRGGARVAHEPSEGV